MKGPIFGVNLFSVRYQVAGQGSTKLLRLMSDPPRK